MVRKVFSWQISYPEREPNNRTVKILKEFVDFRSLVAYRVGEGYANCTNTGFFEAAPNWSINFDIIYMNNQYCKWYIYNPNPTGSVILSFVRFEVRDIFQLFKFC